MQFLSLAKGSAGEALSQLHVAQSQNYIDSEAYFKLIQTGGLTIKMLKSLMDYLRTTSIRGIKFKRYK